MDSQNTEGKPAIRPMEQRDAEAVSLLVEQLGYTRTPQQVMEWIETTNGERQATFVACVDGEIVGWIEVSIERRLQSSPFALIGGLVVTEGMRGKGIGRELCQLAEQWGWEHGAERIRVTSRSTRPDAHRFYTRDGYQVVKTSLVFEKDRTE